MKLDLKNATPEQINAAVAEHVEDARIHSVERDTAWFKWDGGLGQRKIPPYATSADAVLPLLDKHCGQWSCQQFMCVDLSGPIPFEIVLFGFDRAIRATAATFPLAACIALLRAHGVEVKE